MWGTSEIIVVTSVAPLRRCPTSPESVPHFSGIRRSVDGQKFESADPTIKARYSRKYFGKGKGVVAYTLLANHVALQTELIGAVRDQDMEMDTLVAASSGIR